MKRHYHLIWFAALMFLNFTLIVKNLPKETSTLFSGSGNCTLCHSGSGDVLMSDGRDVSPIYHWQSSMMANASKDPYWQAKVSSEVEENPHLKTIIEDKCATCHAPMGRTEAIHSGRTHYTFEEVKNDALSQDGISCTLCHQIDPNNLSKEESFSGHYEIKDTKTIYGPYENPFVNSMRNNTGYTPVHGSHIASSAMCATCHTLSTPYVNQEGEVAGYFPEQMPYYEWLNSNYPSQQTACQNCHMPALNETMRIASMPANLQNKRSPIFEHHFVGGNTIINQIMQGNKATLGVYSASENIDTTIYYTKKNLKENTIDIQSSVQQNEQSTTVNVRLTNKTGHKLPTGFPSRRVWIHFVAQTATGDTIFESGAYNTQGELIHSTPFEVHHDTINTSTQTQIYEAVLGNTNNDVTSILLEASQYLKDNRIPPLGFTNTQSYDSLIAITGKATLDPNFNKENNMQGTGSDIISYTFNTANKAFQYSIEICYQSVKPSYVNHLKASSTQESERFTQMYSNEKSAKVEVIATHKNDISSAIYQDSKAQIWRIGPNPTSGIISIHNMNTPSFHYKLYSLNGTLLEEQTSDNATISLRHMSKGKYILNITNDHNTESHIIMYQ